MKKEFIKYSLLVLVCFSMMACNDWLSVKPKTEMEAEDLFSTEAGFKDALAGVYTAIVKRFLILRYIITLCHDLHALYSQETTIKIGTEQFGIYPVQCPPESTDLRKYPVFCNTVRRLDV